MFHAAIFDFDGLILDTDWPGYLSWQALFEEYGLELPLAVWADYVGTSHAAGPAARLVDLLATRGIAADHEALQADRDRRREALIRTYDPLPGAVAAIHACRAAGLRLAIASSSPSPRIRRHLGFLLARGFDLAPHFEAIICRDHVGDRAKPDPAVYCAALAALDVAPEETFALEDSLNGVRAARAAGLYTIAVPNRSTAMLDFGSADLVLSSLEEFDLAALPQ